MADADSDVYRVGVQVVPDADGFEARLKSQVDPAAQRTGQEISEKISRPIGQKIMAAIFGGVRDGGRAATGEAAKEGDNAGAAFGRTAKIRIEAALRSIPEIELDIDASQAERKAAELRAQLKSLAARIEVTDNFGAELLKIRLIKAELVSLARQIEAEKAAAGRHAIPINVDASQAHYEISALDRDIRQFQRAAEKRIRVEADDDTGSARQGMRQLSEAASNAGRSISLLTFAGALIGPAIIPGALAAAAAIGAIGVAAASVGAAAGVLLLGFRGFGAVLGAATSAQVAGGGAADSYAEKTNRVADAVERAKDAERRYGEEQRELVRVQEAVNDAREEAIDNLHRLANEAEGGALAERQAVLDLEDARARLAAASARDGAQAQLDYDKAVFRLKTIREENRRTAQDKALADARGVEGSVAVVAAQERVRKQTLAVQDAQRDMARAQRDAAAAAAASAGATGAAIGAMQTAYDKAGPAARRFADFLASLKPRLVALQQVAQAGMFPGFEQAIRSMLPALPTLTGFVDKLAKTMGRLAVEAVQSFGSPVYREFAQYIGQVAVPTIEGFVHGIQNLVKGFAGLVVGFAPVNDQIGSGLLRLTERFARFGSTVRDNPDFQRFVAYISVEGPRVMHTLVEVARALLHVAEATAPIGSISLKILTAFAQVIQNIPTPVLTVLIGLIIAVNTALKAYAIASTIAAAATKAWAVVQGGITSVMSEYHTNLVKSAASTGTFNTTLASLQTGANVAKGAIGGVVSLLGGPWGIAIAAATLAVGTFIAKEQEHAAAVDELKTALLSLGAAYKRTGDIGSDAVQSIILNNQALTALIAKTKDYGISVEQVARAAAGEKASQDQVIAALDRKIAALKDESDSMRHNAANLPHDEWEAQLRATDAQYNATVKAKEALQAEFPEIEKMAIAQKALAEVANQYASPAQQRLAEAQLVLASNTADATDKLLAQKTVDEALAQAAISASEAAEAHAAAIDGLTASIKANGKSLDLHSAAGRENRDAIEAVIEASYREYQANLVQAKASKDVAGATAEATAKYGSQLASLRDVAGQLGLNKSDVDTLVASYDHIPEVLETVLRLHGYNLAHEQLAQLGRDASFLNHMQELLQRGFIITAGGNVRYADAGGHAEGGMIGGVGTGTSDSNIARVSKGEFVHRTAAVNYYGPGLMYALNDRRIPRQALAGFATGGMVGAQPTGYRPPGLSLAERAGRPVQAPPNWQPMGQGQGGGRTVNIYPLTVDFTLEQLQAQQSRQDTLERVGRQS